MAFEYLIGRGDGIKRQGAKTPRRRERWPSAKTFASLRLCALALSFAGLKSTAAGATPKTATGMGVLPGNDPMGGRAR
jgi:hypothetical protein